MKSSKIVFKEIAIIGVGLIGGSLALAIKKTNPNIKIIGVDKPSVLKQALKRNAIDVAEHDIASAVKNANLVILATPISLIEKYLPIIAKNILPQTIVTDTGSVKGCIVEKADKLFSKGNFIGGHPMAGSEFSGIGAANPLLFQNAMYILTPTQITNTKLLHHLASLFYSIDARVITINPKTHDSVIAAVSHLPQLASVALMNTVGKYHKTASKHLKLAAGGFRDMTRIASSPFNMWKDILSANKKEINSALKIFISQLNKIVKAINMYPNVIGKEFKSSRMLRLRIPRSMKGFMAPLVELNVFVEDKPGQLAKLTSSLSNKKINIKDMELIKVREGAGGTFRLAFENHAIAKNAAQVLQKNGFELSGF